ncbi:MAG TPA: cytochrome c peroxidase [Terriglobales bacterium]|nr:cytochrome c peroxidase [Terriglobales bacterium]
MKRSSGTLALLRVFVGAVLVIAGLGYYAHVRAQSNDNNPSGVGSVIVPLRPLAPLSSVPVPPVFGIEGIVADKTAAIELGKTLFWDMQAGSDDIQACASCHFNAGADSRVQNQVNPGQAGGDNTFQLGVNINGSVGPNYHYKAGSPDAGFGGYHDGDFPFRKVANENDRFSVISDVNDVSGSQGIFPMTMGQIIVGRQRRDGSVAGNNGAHAGDNNSPDPTNNSDLPLRGNNPHNSSPNAAGSSHFSTTHGSTSTGGGSRVSVIGSDVTSAEIDNPVVDPVFSYPDPANPGARINTRRTGGRNAPSVVDAVFNYRNFWDGRAQNVCNGNNPFGARDKTAHLAVMEPDGTLGAALVNMDNSALCSQSLGPILSNAEMSADGRNLAQVGRKLLARKPLAKQFVDPTDSILGSFSAAPANGLTATYPALIEKAFQPEWWNFNLHVCEATDGSIASTINPDRGRCPSGTTEYSQMEYNFSLFWGVAIQMYESTLIADQTPLDKYLEQQTTYTLIGDNLTNQYTIQLKPGVTPYTISIIGLNPTLDASDQDMFAFDDGQGVIRGVGVNGGSINYATGTLTVFFGEPPVSEVPVKIAYSNGPTPLTQSQLRGLNIFQTKGQCVVCHGGPELSNATVGTVGDVPVERMIMEDDSARVYDTGFYHIGIRPTAEDAGLGGTDPVAGMPLSQAEVLREDACKGGFETVLVPGRRGDGIAASPMNCSDPIARGGFFKAPQLRNVALTAPYFHNGSRLTLEQVVEFYNRGGDFNTVDEVQYMDPDVEMLGLTRQDEEDLVDFLRNGLTDQRTVNQAAPFDHPQLFTPNGHPADSNGYPVQKDPQHPAQATTQFLEVPATGANGGKPLPTFLENLLGVSNANPK